jgi:hypothetical protein
VSGFGGNGNTSIGTISSVRGNTIYLTTTSGKTVKVTLSAATKIGKNLSVSHHSIRPGDSVVIQGKTRSDGTVSATSVSDSGASGTGSSSTASSGSGTAGSAGTGRGSSGAGSTAASTSGGGGAGG